MIKDALEAAIDNLATYLSTQVSGLTVLKEWPMANQKLTYPSLTIFSNNPKFTNLSPYQVACTAPDQNKQVLQTLVVGEWDTTVQLDIWCRNKLERQTVGKYVKDAINKDIIPQGLSLQMADYFDEWARYDMTEYVQVDDEAGAQRQEFRTKISLAVNVKELTQRTQYAIIQLSPTDPVVADDIEIGEDVQIP